MRYTESYPRQRGHPIKRVVFALEVPDDKSDEEQGGRATRRRHSEEFKHEALGLAEKIGVSEAARELGLHSSQLYGWRSKAELVKTRGQIDQEQAKENARLKRQLAEKNEELAILKKAAAYFAQGLK
jgi:transposase